MIRHKPGLAARSWRWLTRRCRIVAESILPQNLGGLRFHPRRPHAVSPFLFIAGLEKPSASRIQKIAGGVLRPAAGIFTG
jgi:hypothetical protein